MTTRRQSGNNFQNWIEKWVLKEFPGAAVHNFKPVLKRYFIPDPVTKKPKQIFRSANQDLFNCIDLEIKLPTCGKMIYIQATLHTSVRKRLDELSVVLWDFDHQIVQLWQKKEPGRIVVQQLRYKELEGYSKIILDEAKKQKIYPVNILEFYKIGEIQRGKYIPVIGDRLCDEVRAL